MFEKNGPDQLNNIEHLKIFLGEKLKNVHKQQPPQKGFQNSPDQ